MRILPLPPSPPSPGHWLAGAALLGLSGPIHAASPPPSEPTLALRAGGAWLADGVPPFWTEPRDRGQAEVRAWWQPTDRVGVGARFDAWRADRYPDGSTHSGPGDLRLETALGLWQGAVPGRLRWEVKLPDADDEEQLGTDETDVHLGLELARAQGPLALSVRGGVAVLGDPLRATHQAWLPELQAEALLAAGPVSPGAGLTLTTGGDGEPARGTAALRVEGRCPWLAGAEGLVGLSAAAPDWGGRAWVGWGFGCAPAER
ncbi:hypothetical protein L6R53_19280 [Myxococcota bacterium]|nr:hypothetical protein [Myxococcota bacterium]